MNVVAIIQARMRSSRFPGKMLASLCNRPVLGWTVGRVEMAQCVDKVAVATSESTEDDDLADWCVSNGITVFRGSEQDVLDRFYRCAQKFHASHVVRLTGDCPLLDPDIVDQVVRLAIEDTDVEYASNVEPLTYPEGMSVEVMPFHSLETAWRESTLKSHREHVTPYIRFHTERFKHAILRSNPDLSHIRLTVDYKEDLDALRRIVQALRSRGFDMAFDMNDILEVLDRNPAISSTLDRRRRDLWRQEVARDEGRSDIT